MPEIPFLSLAPQHTPLHDEINLAIANVVKSNNFVLGEYLSTFERHYAAYHQVRYCVGVANGLDAIYLSLKALGIQKGDEVIVPSNTYIATWLAVERAGATIVPIEPNENTCNLDVFKLEKTLTAKTKCIIPVHLFGQACQMDEIMRIAKKYSLFVVEDNAQAHGAMCGSGRTGSFGDANATSFYPTKNLGAWGDGGAITLSDEKVYTKICALRNYGSSKRYFNEVLGVNSRLDEIQAAILSVKLKYLDSWIEQRKSIASMYSNLLNGVGDLVLPSIAEGSTHVFHIFPVRSSHRDPLQNHLTSKGIGTIVHYPLPPHLQKAFSYLGYEKGDFPIAEKMADTSLSLPIWPGLSEEQIEFIADSIKSFFKNHL
jgi:dTDP-4-amino-4,6-dideoxygalactose transaminase